jgi:hypothetical protein
MASDAAGFISATSDKVTQEFRVTICEWIYRLVDHLQIDRDVALTSLYFLDRFVSNLVTENSASVIELVAMTSLFLASKLNGSRPQPISMNLLNSLMRSSIVTTERIKHVEILLISSLQWYVNPPTAKAILQELLELRAQSPKETAIVGDDVVLKQLSNYAHFFTELSVFDTSLVRVQASVISMASLLNALELIGEEESDDILKIKKDYEAFQHNIGFVRSRLRSLYSQTEECARSNINQMTHDGSDSKRQWRDNVDMSPSSVVTIPPQAHRVGNNNTNIETK